MTNLDKMNELVGLNAEKQEIISWAYSNRITVATLDLYEPFEPMVNSVDVFVDLDLLTDDEFENWDNFLDSEFISND